MIRVALLLLFLLSGAAGLVYEVAWTRRLVLVLGNSTHAVSLILAAFMLGLALGSWLFGRIADRLRRPVLLYGLLEAGIGVYALVFPVLLGLVTDFYVSLGPATGTSYLVKFVLAFLLLVIPAVLMGGTLPVIVRWATERLEVVGGRVGAFYAANPFGAVAGCFLAGYVLIEQVGVIGATRVAAIGNLAVAAAAIVLGLLVTGSRSAPEPESTAEGPDVAPGLVHWSAAAFAASGFCALALEVLWFRMLVFFLQGFTWAFTAMLTTFLLGLAVGAAFWGRIVPRVKNPVRFLGAFLVAVAAGSAVAQILMVRMFGIWDAIRDDVMVGWGVPYRYALFLGALVVLFLPTFLMGGVFPIVSRIAARSLDSVGRSVGWIYALNTVGAVLGSFVAGLILVPLLGMQLGVILVIAIEAVVGVALLVRAGRATPAWWGVSIGAPVAIVVVLVLLASPFEPFIARSHVFRGPLGSSRKLLDYDEGAMCAVSVVEDEVTGFRTLYTDEFAAAATGDHYRYMRMLGHLPLMLSRERKDVLVIAFGTGTTAGSVAAHEGVERLDVVEISQEVLDVASYFSDVNKDVLTRPGPPAVETHVMDGRNFVLTTDRRYDVVTLEPLMPYTPAAVNLYTKEFYEVCRRVLEPGGVMCQWIPIHAMTVDDYKMLARAFTDVFPDSSVWFFETTSAIIGRTEPGKIDHARVLARAAEPRVAEDLRAIGLEDPEAVLSCFVTGGADLVEFLADVDPMTDERPLIEFHPVGYGALNSFFMDNLGTFFTLRKPVTPWLDLTGAGDEAEAIGRELAVRYERGQDFLLARNQEEAWTFETNHKRHGRAAAHLRNAVKAYDDAIARAPELVDPVLARYRDGARYHLLVFTALGHLNLGQRSEAIGLLRTAVTLAPPEKPHQAFFLLGRTLLEDGEVLEAERMLARAVELYPRRAEYREALEASRARAEDVSEDVLVDTRADIAATLTGAVRATVLGDLRERRGKMPALAARLEPELRDVMRRVLDVRGVDRAVRDRGLRLLLVLEPAWLQEALGRVVADPAQGIAIRRLATQGAARRPGHEHLFERLRDGDAETRALVARTLGEVRATDAAAPLVESLADDEADVRLQAYLALHAITGRQLGYDPMAAPGEREAAIRRWREFLATTPD